MLYNHSIKNGYNNLNGGNMNKKIIVVLLLVGLTVVGCSKKTVDENDGMNNVKNEDSQAISLLASGTVSNINEFEIKVGNDLSKLVFKTIDGKEIKISDYRKTPVFLNFWSTKSDDCTIEFPSLNKSNSENRPVVIAINVSDSEAEVRKYIKENDLNMDVVLDKDDVLKGAFGISKLPTTVLIGKKGKLAGVVVVKLDDNIIENLVKEIDEAVKR